MQANQKPHKESIVFFYRNQFTSQHKQDERIITKTIKQHVTPANADKTINLQIYYKSKKLKSLFIHNKSFKSEADDHVVYHYQCNEDSCNAVDYIGYTTCSLAKRFYYHNQSGSIFKHNQNSHNRKPGSRHLRDQTTVLYKSNNKRNLCIAEAILIKQSRPSLNEQEEGRSRILHIF